MELEMPEATVLVRRKNSGDEIFLTGYWHYDAHAKIRIVGLQQPHGREVTQRAACETAQRVDRSSVPCWSRAPEGSGCRGEGSRLLAGCFLAA